MPKRSVSPATSVSSGSLPSPRLEVHVPTASVGNGHIPTANGALAPPDADPDGGASTAAVRKPKLTARLTRMFSHRSKDSLDGANEPDGAKRARSASNPVSQTQPDPDHLSVASAATAMPERSRVTTPRGNTPDGDKRGRSRSGGSDRADKDVPDVWKRFEVHADGTHEHHLKAVKRQEKLSDMLRDLLVGKRRDDHNNSNVHIIHNNGNNGNNNNNNNNNSNKNRTGGVAAAPSPVPPAGPGKEQQLSLMSGWVDQFRHERDKLATDKIGGPNATASLVEKYGRCQEVVGRGAFGIVRVAHKADPRDGRAEQLYAVKEFRRRPQESAKRYQKRLTSEFCISASLRHPNVIHTLDLLQDSRGDYCEVMEFCAGGDLYTLVLAAAKLDVAEADCFFKQLMRGVEYMHEMGVAHRDLKPENLLLTTHGSLKITDFGNGECFRMAWETDARMTAGLCGSAPYIAPEEYTEAEFDPRAVDVWACGVIYMAMRTGRHLWTRAKDDGDGADEFYDRYLDGRRDEAGYGPIESLHRVRSSFVLFLLLPLPSWSLLLRSFDRLRLSSASFSFFFAVG